MEFAGEMVSVVARASGPEGVRVDGLKVHVAPEGKLATGDVLLAQKIALETMEQEVLTLANTQACRL